MRYLVFLLVSIVMFAGCDPPRKPKRLPPAPKPNFEESKVETVPSDDEQPIEDLGPIDKITQFTPSAEHAPPRDGNFGYIPNKAETARFLKSLEAPTLREAAPHLFTPEEPKRAIRRTGHDKSDPSRGPPLSVKEPTLLYRARYEVAPGWKPHKQGIGDCVSHGWGLACDTALAVDRLTGKSGDWQESATEAIYGGSRVEARNRSEGSGGWSDGSYGSAAANFVNRFGVIFRQPFPQLGYDLTTYSSQRAKQWGNWGCGGEGDRGRLDTIAKQHPVQQVALVRTFEEAAAAIDSGYPVAVCSMQGFANNRDKDGFASPSGSWAHCMEFDSTRYDRPGLLCQNSWGSTWINGPKWPDDARGPPGRPQPDGSFWVDKSVVNRMLAGQDSFAVANLKGFPKRQLHHDKGW